jgi:hypothetical protein
VMAMRRASLFSGVLRLDLGDALLVILEARIELTHGAAHDFAASSGACLHEVGRAAHRRERVLNGERRPARRKPRRASPEPTLPSGPRSSETPKRPETYRLGPRKGPKMPQSQAEDPYA